MTLRASVRRRPRLSALVLTAALAAALLPTIPLHSAAAPYRTVARQDKVTIGAGKSANVNVLGNDTVYKKAKATVRITARGRLAGQVLASNRLYIRVPAATSPGTHLVKYKVVDALKRASVSTVRVTVPKAKPKKRPNVVLVVTDDMRKDELAYMPKTRNLLGNYGTTFTDAISPHPLCCPARAEIFTAQYAHNNGVRHNDGPHGGYEAFNPKSSIARRFKTAGYQTAMIGKYLNRYMLKSGRNPGWDYWSPLVAGVADYRDFQFYDGAKYRNNYITDRIADRTVDRVKKFAANKKPFMMTIFHVGPHDHQNPSGIKDPIPATRHKNLHKTSQPSAIATKNPAFNEADVTDKPGYMTSTSKVSSSAMTAKHRARVRSLAAVDEAVARLVTVLTNTGQLSNTVLMFTSDNGYLLGEHRLTGKNRLYQEALDIPLLVRGPGFARGTSDKPASLVDLPATMMAAAGITATGSIDGRDLRSNAYPRDTTLIQHGTDRTAANTSQWGYKGVRAGRYTYAYDTRSPKHRFLFDQTVDPHEVANFVDDPRYAAVVAELHRRTQTLAVCKGRASCNRVFGPIPAPLSEEEAARGARR